MRILWLTLADPEPPTNGQFLYSRGLIRAVAGLGVEVHVVGLARSGGTHRRHEREDGIEWSLAEHRPRSKYSGIFSSLPFLTFRTKTDELQRLVAEHCAQGPWDAIIFDSITLGWALAENEGFRSGAARPPLVYVSHNHESAAARFIADTESNPIKRFYKERDARKVARFERDLAESVDLVTANTEDDCLAFLAKRPGLPVVHLPPGYGGRRVAQRTITAKVPRRAIVVGTFDWPPKRKTLEQFLAVADELFSAAGIELQVVGGADPAFLESMRSRYASAAFIGSVPSVAPYLDRARIALVPDNLGGFKLKTLDYVFGRVPILGVEGAVPGVPLRHGENILLFSDHKALAEGVVRAIDDLDLLNAMQERAFEACRHRFDWSDLARRLIEQIGTLPARAHADRAA